MNEYDSGRMVGLMQQAYGLKLVEDPEKADVILMNTCSVREKAEEKVFSELGRYRKIKEKRPDLVIGVGGCVAQQEGERILQRAPYVDLIFGPQTYHTLPEMVNEVRRDRVRKVNIAMPENEKFDRLPPPGLQGVCGSVTIMEGCDKFCTYCIVPYTRGGELSRPAADVLEECRKLIAAGAKEITLLGQNVNGWRAEGLDGEEWDFATLLHAVSGLEGLLRLRFTTSHPLEVDEGLVEAFATLPKLMPFFHLPVQSGSDEILRAMHRGHDRAHYLRVIRALRTACPHISLASDFIVGFPGETEEDFEQTLSIVREADFDAAFSFKYSPRPGTPAAQMGDTVPEAVKDARLQRLLELMKEQSRKAHERYVGRIVEVLIEGPGREVGDLMGRTPDHKIVHLRGMPRLIGQLLDVRIVRAYGQSLRGEVEIAE